MTGLFDTDYITRLEAIASNTALPIEIRKTAAQALQSCLVIEGMRLDDLVKRSKKDDKKPEQEQNNATATI